jgi:hypothetical protein
MVALGDSIMWGQGLPEASKFRNIVQHWLQSEYGGTRTVRQFARAHSGAQVVVDGAEVDYDPGLPGEIPSGHPSIRKQVELVTGDLQRERIAPDTVDLVLLDGGINDVGVTNILLPTNSTGAVRGMVDTKLAERMKVLLQVVTKTFPHAAVVVVGYYPIASRESDLKALMALLAAVGSEGGTYGAVGGLALGAVGKDQIVDNSAEFNARAYAALSNAIAQLQPAGGSALALAWPRFQSENGYAAPHTYLWRVEEFAGPEARGVTGKHPESQTTPDGVAYTRAQACAAANRASPKCLDASMGHPNELGARAYADAVIEQLQGPLSTRLGLPHRAVTTPPVGTCPSGEFSTGDENRGCTCPPGTEKRYGGIANSRAWCVNPSVPNACPTGEFDTGGPNHGCECPPGTQKHYGGVFNSEAECVSTAPAMCPSGRFGTGGAHHGCSCPAGTEKHYGGLFQSEAWCAR